MAVRPPQIRYLTEGKALGASIHKGFVATWNWLLSCVNFFKGGLGLRVSSKGNGHPVADVLIEGGEGIDVTCAGAGEPYIVALAGADGTQGPSTGSVTFTGTDGVAGSAGSAFTFASASDSNVVVTASGTTITIGVYWT